jgi:hypothetical protein
LKKFLSYVRLAVTLIIVVGLQAASAPSATPIQTLRGTWFLKIGGEVAKIVKLTQSGTRLSGTVLGPNEPNTYTETISGELVTSGRGYMTLTLTEQENGVQDGKKGPYIAAYAGKQAGNKYVGTFYDEDGKKDFELTR